jgi:hypothetical protein
MLRFAKKLLVLAACLNLSLAQIPDPALSPSGSFGGLSTGSFGGLPTGPFGKHVHVLKGHLRE